MPVSDVIKVWELRRRRLSRTPEFTSGHLRRPKIVIQGPNTANGSRNVVGQNEFSARADGAIERHGPLAGGNLDTAHIKGVGRIQFDFDAAGQALLFALLLDGNRPGSRVDKLRA